VDWGGLVSGAEREFERDDEHQVTPLELFFDLVFVFALTQVTSLLADNPTWGGVFRGMLVLAALWWAWSAYAWLTSAMDVDEGGVRLAMLASTAAMFGVALAVPGAFGDDAVLFGVAYLLVRLLHLVLSVIVVGDDSVRSGALLRFAPTAMVGASLLVLAGFLEGNERIAVWLVALVIDYLGPVVIGVGGGWQVAPEHFAERHSLIVLIALGESLIAIGVGVGFDLDTGAIAASALGIVVVSALWWLYFDVAAIFARRRLMEARGLELHRLALHAYSYLHLPMVAGIVLFALGLKTTVSHVADSLDIVPAVAFVRRRGALPGCRDRVPLPNDGPSLSTEDDRGRRPACTHSSRGRDPGPGRPRARQRCLLAAGRVRGDRASRVPGEGAPPRAFRMTRLAPPPARVRGCRLRSS
jgi:low temperature requirement protein LtrA